MTRASTNWPIRNGAGSPTSHLYAIHLCIDTANMHCIGNNENCYVDVEDSENLENFTLVALENCHTLAER